MTIKMEYEMLRLLDTDDAPDTYEIRGTTVDTLYDLTPDTFAVRCTAVEDYLKTGWFEVVGDGDDD